MSHFCADQWFEIIDCCSCHLSFGMQYDHYQQRKKDQQTFYCPSCGCNQHFTGKTEAQKLKDKLENKQRQLEQEQERNQELEQQKNRVQAQYKRVRKRIKNGVCPCCNRSFENLANHMRTQHPEFADDKELKTLRLAYGLTQEGLAEECGVYAQHISLYENSKPLTKWARDAIENWVTQQAS
jgi:DNA-binding XRE family transcriptional regulator